jgi:hypothetical protein
VIAPNEVAATSSSIDCGRTRAIDFRSRSLQSCEGRMPARRAASSRQWRSAPISGSTCARGLGRRGSGGGLDEVDVGDQRADRSGVAAAAPGAGDDQTVGGAGERNVEQSGLFGATVGGRGRLVGDQAGLDAGDEHGVPFAPLGAVEGEEVDAVGGGVVERVGRRHPPAERRAVPEGLLAQEVECCGRDAALGVGLVGRRRIVERRRLGRLQDVVRPAPQPGGRTECRCLADGGLQR